MNTAINTALFAFLVAAMAYVGPALDEADRLAEQSRQQIKVQQAEELRDRAAREICGQNAAIRFNDSVLTCLTKKGRKTKEVSL